MKLNKNCPVCQTKEGELLGLLKYTMFDDSPLSNEINLVNCKYCGFVFYDTHSSQEDYDKYYKESFYSSEYINRDKNEIKYIDSILNNLSSYIKNKNISIFDIGCGTGTLLQKLKELGFRNIYGIDPSLSCINLLKNKEINAKIGSIFNIPFEYKKADIIIIAHVLEHIIDLPIALQSIKNKLSKNGLIYVEVPDINRYELFNKSPLRYFYLTHITHFDRNHLRNLFFSNGYHEVKSGHSMRVEGELTMPCVWAVFRKADESLDGKMSIIHDFHLTNLIRKWFDNIHSMDTNNIFTNLASNNRSTYIWGIGIHTQMMLGMSPLRYCNIVRYIDSDKRNQGKTINGKIIYPPNILYEATDKDAVVIGAPTHSDKMCRQLIEQYQFKGQIIKIGFKDVTLL